MEPFTLLESFACGTFKTPDNKPCVTLRLNGTAYLVPPAMAKALIEGVQKSLQMLPERKED